MRTIWSLLGATLLLTACGTNQQEQMAFQNTIPIEPNDSKEMIIEKAAHVVPTENQLQLFIMNTLHLSISVPILLPAVNGEQVWKTPKSST